MVVSEAVHICVYGILFGSLRTAIVFTVESCVCVCLLFWSFRFLSLATLLAVREEAPEVMEAKTNTPRVELYGSMVLKV
jgi:hypothetical protein